MRARRRVLAAVSDIFTGVPAEPSADAPAAGSSAAATYGTRLGSHLLSRPGRLVVACLATVLGPAVVAQAGAIDARPVAEATAAAAEPAGGVVPVPVPGDRATWVPAARQAAATCPGLAAAVLVAIAHIESNLGQMDVTSSAGAAGPMQFLPSTWEAYGVDGDGDGRRDAMNPVDAMHGAARLLCANGGADPNRLPSAVWNYNHSDVYVARVMSLTHLLPLRS